MKRFLSVVGAFIIATGMSGALFTGLGFAESLGNPDDETTEETECELTPQEAKEVVERYHDSVTEEELDNKTINVEGKDEVLAAYQCMQAEDQESYAELIARIERGGIPQLTYIGATEYDSADSIEYYKIVKAVDNEDGEITLSEDNTSYQLTEQTTREAAEEDASKTYTLNYSVTDSDGNVGELSQEIAIKVASSDDGDDSDDDDSKEDPDPGDNPDDDDDPGDDDPGNDNPDDDPGDDNPGDDDGDDPKNDPDDKDPDDGSGTTAPEDPNKPSTPADDNSDNKIPSFLPNTGPSDIFGDIPAAFVWSVVIGIFAATTVFCLTKKTTPARELVK